MKIEIGNRDYNVVVVKTEEDRVKGLQGVEDLKDSEGMLFVFDKPQTVGFWMKDTLIPLDIIYINDNGEVLSVYHGEPLNEDIAKEDDVKYVLEVNINSGIEPGDDLEIDDNDQELQILGSDGTPQMTVGVNSRLFSRKNTVTLIKMAKRADLHQEDKYYKALGKKVFKYLDIQDTNKREYIEK